MFAEEEIAKILKDPSIFLRALETNIEYAPGLKPTAIAKIMAEYQTRLLDAFGIE